MSINVSSNDNLTLPNSLIMHLNYVLINCVKIHAQIKRQE